MLTSGGAAAAAAAPEGDVDLSSILSNVGAGGVGGAVVMAVIGFVQSQMSKS
jgi:hypothetical protein